MVSKIAILITGYNILPIQTKKGNEILFTVETTMYTR